MTQPPMSRQIKELERLVGTPLFERSSTGAVLTATGRQFLEQAHALQQQLRGFEQRLDDWRQQKQPWSIGITSVQDPSVFTDLRARFEALLGAVDYRYDLSMLNVARLEKSRLDLAIIGLPMLRPANISIVPLRIEPMCLALPEENSLIGRKSFH